ncbi:hypothetical protein BOX30_09670 [Leptospirillum ferriphilum]|jgi:hypothetical protein|uniref:Uncharacterized protein n=1 Tax=Leptospirillum ferriphilum TaxID=178606 RepID=A0A1V3SUV4_9BACT|nr:hypothetical protein BOX24_07330 [Leptospirillum ferriphilum]OOH77534.1 hypothetical protein BOX30_09670 [Leptospirillum ferriphilum]
MKNHQTSTKDDPLASSDFLREKSTWMCDDFRIEITSKLILVGIYPPTPVVPVIFTPGFPVTVPSLCFVQLFESDRDGIASFTSRIQNLESGRQIGGEVTGRLRLQKGQIINLLRFGGLPFQQAGSFGLSTQVEGCSDPFTANFDVKLFTPPSPSSS